MVFYITITTPGICIRSSCSAFSSISSRTYTVTVSDINRPAWLSCVLHLSSPVSAKCCSTVFFTAVINSSEDLPMILMGKFPGSIGACCSLMISVASHFAGGENLLMVCLLNSSLIMFHTGPGRPWPTGC